MTDHAIIAGSLVDVRNVGAHKSMRLTIHVPEEHALRVINAFGWPTGVNPVHVAIARLQEGGGANSGTSEPDNAPPPVDSAKQREAKAWRSMSPAQQAGILCNDEAFISYLAHKHGEQITDEKTAAEFVRFHCIVPSRADIRENHPSGRQWRELVEDFRGWMREAEMVPA